jgi:DHA1 family bicyclomycin/chloramphenicol resistance-like MFS transporter
VLVLILLPDTLPPNRRLKLGVAAQLTRWGGIIVERGFITNVLLGGFSMFGMFAFLGGSPSVFIEHFHLAPSFYGAIFGCSACGLIVASQLNPILLGRFGPNRMLHASTRTMLTACIVLTVVAFSGSGSWIAVAAPIAVAMSCQGFTGPNATVAALSRHGATAGSASALMGTIQFVLGAVSGVLVGELADGTARPMALLMLFGAVGAAICDLCRPKPKIQDVRRSVLVPQEVKR